MGRAVRTVVLGLVVGMLSVPAPAGAAEFINPWAGVVFGNVDRFGGHAELQPAGGGSTDERGLQV